MFRSRDTRINSKSAHAHRKNNLRQRFVTLLRKFKVPDDEVLASSRSASVALVPTDKELQDLFEELENMSDSGPEMAADEISIGSNPRPVLRPYFTRSREVLPAIYDRVSGFFIFYTMHNPNLLLNVILIFQDADIASDSDGDGDDLEWSSETENAKENCQGFGSSQTTIKDLTIMQQIPHIVGPSTPVKPQTRVGSTCSAPLASSASLLGMPHSLTTGSIARKGEKIDCSKNISILDQLSLLLSDSGVSRDCIWLCSLSDFPHLSSLSITMINCSSSTFIKQAMAQIVNKIQNFCNSNSANPPITYIGIMGGDKIVGQVVRAYVDCLHHKSSSNWLQYLRFVLLPCPHSLMARLIDGIDPAIDQLSRDIWERWADLSTFEKASINDRLEKWSSGTGGCFSLPIGEALLQLADRGGELEAGRVFVPFLSEVRVGQTEDDSESAGTSPRGGTDDKEPSGATSMPSGSSCSPPNSPHIRTDVHEMHVEYWLGKDCGNENVCLAYSQNTTPTSKKDSSKGSMKAAFRTLIVSRVSSHPLLSLTFVKEKRKEKMLQKLGMKKGQKSDMEGPPVQISHVARLLCSGTSKHSDLIG
uniref:Phosphofurin acidic cluster sorting protein 2 n=1 Tax=Heterorhabditis bacteriophora TaxID=37862 RepID=A0A1I7XLU6_HETBA